jgi:hypothetical protein
MANISSILSNPTDIELNSKKSILCHKSWYLLSNENDSGNLVILLNASAPKLNLSVESIELSNGYHAVLSSESWGFNYMIKEDIEHLNRVNVYVVPVTDERTEVIKLMFREKQKISKLLKEELIGLSDDLKNRYIEQNYDRYMLSLLEIGAVNLADFYIERKSSLMGFDGLRVSHQGV